MVRKDLVHVGSGSSVCVEQRMRDGCKRDEDGEISDGEVEKSLGTLWWN